MFLKHCTVATASLTVTLYEGSGALLTYRPRVRGLTRGFTPPPASRVSALSFMPELVDEAIGGQQPALAWIKYESYKSPSRVLIKTFWLTVRKPACESIVSGEPVAPRAK